MLNEIKEDIFENLMPTDIIAHCISKDCALGAGIAKNIEKRFNIREDLKNILKINPSATCILHKNVINLITKEKYYNKPTLNSLHTALEKMYILCKKNNIKKVKMPRIGCGLDKLQWADVKKIIESIFNNEDIIIEVYYL